MNKRKITAWLLSAVLMLTMSGCQKKEENPLPEDPVHAPSQEVKEDLTPEKSDNKQDAPEEKPQEDDSPEKEPEESEEEEKEAEDEEESEEPEEEAEDYFFEPVPAKYSIEESEWTASGKDGKTEIVQLKYQMISLDPEEIHSSRLNKALEEYNRALTVTMAENFDSLKENAAEIEESGASLERLPLYMDFVTEVSYNDGKVFSFSGIADSYYGGPHGMTQYLYYNYDCETGKMLDPQDIFKDLQGFLKKVSEDLYNDYGHSIEYNVNQLDQWIFTEKGIKLLFNTYTLGSYAAGYQELDYAADEIGKYLQDGYFK